MARGMEICMKTECPRCNQDFVKIAEIPILEKKFFFCPECEACWDNKIALLSKNQVYGLTFFDLTNLLKVLNLDYSEFCEISSDLPDLLELV
jgi:hypothetical protein